MQIDLQKESLFEGPVGTPRADRTNRPARSREESSQQSSHRLVRTRKIEEGKTKLEKKSKEKMKNEKNSRGKIKKNKNRKVKK